MIYQQYNPPHPGELIQSTYIDPYKDISSDGIADRLKVTRNFFNRLVKGESGLSAEMAIRLSAVLGGSAESWLALQQSHDLFHARQAVDPSKLKRIEFSTVETN